VEDYDRRKNNIRSGTSFFLTDDERDKIRTSRVKIDYLLDSASLRMVKHDKLSQDLKADGSNAV
jgi:hypothetical protein